MRLAVATAGVLAGLGCSREPAPATTVIETTPHSSSLERLAPVGGSVHGLVGAGLRLREGDVSVGVARNGTFSFPLQRSIGTRYHVEIERGPVNPVQSCAVLGGDGTLGLDGVTSVRVECGGDLPLVGAARGVQGSNLALLRIGGEAVAVGGEGTFAFPSPAGPVDRVVVLHQPESPTQVCSVDHDGLAINLPSGGTPLELDCSTSKFAIGGTVSGLIGAGLKLKQGGETISIGKSGTFRFPTKVASGDPFSVSVAAQPAWPPQTCTVNGASGVVVAADVESVAVSCSKLTFTVGGQASGVRGVGLELASKKLGSVSVTANGSFALPGTIGPATLYDVGVVAQPHDPSQTCILSGGVGKVAHQNVTSLGLTCTTNRYTVGGTVQGLVGTGLVLSQNGKNFANLGANGPFAFSEKVESGSVVTVAVAASPSSPSQTCTAKPSVVVVGSKDISNINVVCSTDTFKVGGVVSGLIGSGLVLENDGVQLPIGANGAFAFPKPIVSGSNYGVTVVAQPTGPAQSCTIQGGTGVVSSGPVTSVSVQCSPTSVSIGGAVSGLVGSGLVLQNNAGDPVSINGNGTFAFPTPLSNGASYDVQVAAQPAGPPQLCTVTHGTGTAGGMDITTVRVDCTTLRYLVGGKVMGVLGQGLVLHDALGGDVPIGADGSFVLPNPVESGRTYAVVATSLPKSPWQSCSIANGSGVVGESDVSSIDVSCSTNEYFVGGTVTGLSTNQIAVSENDGAESWLTADGSFTFPQKLPSGASYDVKLTIQPADPELTCTVDHASGMVAGGDVGDVTISCAPRPRTKHRYFADTKTSTAPWHERDGARLEFFNGRYWLLGGWWPDGGTEWGSDVTTNAIWSSADLENWQLELPHDPAPPTTGPNARWRRRHTFMTAVKDGYLWVLGGDASDGAIPSDVWRSNDGVSWERVAASAPWGPVYLPIIGVFQGAFHVLGGFSPTDWKARRDHWRSVDGVNWDRLPDMPFARASVTNAVVKDDRLFVIGGKTGDINGDDRPTDTWSWNGIDWVQTSSSAEWPGREWIGTASYDGKLWVLTGSARTNLGGLRYSEDSGATWVEAGQFAWPGSHADGITVGPHGIAIASGNGMATSAFTLSALPTEATSSTAALPWTAWFDGAAYNPVDGTILGKPSTGSSGQRLFGTRGAPVGTALNGWPAIALDGTDDYIEYHAGGEASDLLGDDAWTLVFVGRVGSTTGDPEPYANPSLGGCSNADFAVDLRSDGAVRAYQFFGGIDRVASTTWSSGTTVVYQARFDGTTLSIRRGKQPWASITSGSTVIGGTFKIGTNYSATRFGRIDLAEYATTNVALPTPTLDAVSDELTLKWGALP